MYLEMDASYALPSSSIFQELQRIHDTGYFSPIHSLEDKFQQVSLFIGTLLIFKVSVSSFQDCLAKNRGKMFAL